MNTLKKYATYLFFIKMAFLPTFISAKAPDKTGLPTDLKSLEELLEKDAIKPNFFIYTTSDWELVYNPTTKEVWHLNPL